MSWVTTVPEEQLKPRAQEIFDVLRENWGLVPNYFLALGHDPQLLEDQTNLFAHTMEDRALPKPLKEQLALLVSGLNFSSYCLAVHMQILSKIGIDKPLARKLAADFTTAPVEPKVMELFRFAEKLTRRPGDMEKQDIERLRDAGWGDKEIVEAVLVISLHACANRFSAGLGLIADF